VSARKYALVATRKVNRFIFEAGRAIGTESAIVAVEIDVDDLALKFGIRAMCNKSGVARIAGGRVRVRVTRKVEP
jgi:hypothetical protein